MAALSSDVPSTARKRGPVVGSGVRSTLRALWGILSLALGVSATANAALAVNLEPTLLGGGVFQYEVSVSNTGPRDVVIVTITDAPTADALIESSLTAPAGFGALYTSDFGFIDLFEGTELFGAGTTHGGFTFQSSASAATGFTSFEAFDVDANFISGSTTVVPVPAGILLALSGLAVLARIGARRSTTEVQA